MRRRMVLFAAATALVAVALLAVPLGILAGHGYLQAEQLRVERQAVAAAVRAGGDIATAPGDLGVDDPAIQATVYDRAGRRVSGPGPLDAPATIQDAWAGKQTAAVVADSITVAAPISDGDQVVAALLLSKPLDTVRSETARAWLALAGMCVSAALLASLGAWLFARRLTRPMDRLTAGAARVGSGDLSARMPRSGIAEIDALADTLDRTVARINALIGKERALSTEVSHQLRTPLSGLRLDLEAIQADAADADAAPDTGIGPEGQRALARSIRTVDRLDATITDVIQLARDITPREPSDLNVLLEAAFDRWYGPLAAANRPLRLGVEPRVPANLQISSAAATQILDILLDNAVRHGRGAVQIGARLIMSDSGDGEAISVEVSDEGPTLTLEAWELFGGSEAATVSDGRGGTSRADATRHGLGLPYARRLAEAEGARLVLVGPTSPTFALVVPATLAQTDRQPGYPVDTY